MVTGEDVLRVHVTPGLRAGGVTVAERGLFVGGPLHGQMRDTYGHYNVVAHDLRDVGVLDEWAGARIPHEVIYSRYRMWLEVDGVKRVREVWASGGHAPSEDLVKNALLIHWFAGAPQADVRELSPG